MSEVTTWKRRRRSAAGSGSAASAAASDSPVSGSPLAAEELSDWPPAATASRRWGLVDPHSPVPVLLGVGLTLIGFALMAVAWAKVAGLVDVWRQFPYLLSAGLPGLGLVMVGLVLVNISVRRQDAAERERQFAALTESIRELRQAVDD